MMAASELLDGRLLNSDRLTRLYDPAYVCHMDEGSDAPVQVCLDAAMLDADRGTGVATYAAVLRHCLKAAGAVPAVLGDERGAGGARRSRLDRWVSALDRRARRARPRPPSPP